MLEFISWQDVEDCRLLFLQNLAARVIRRRRWGKGGGEGGEEREAVTIRKLLWGSGISIDNGKIALLFTKKPIMGEGVGEGGAAPPQQTQMLMK